MSNENHGLQIFEDNGNLLIEVGPYVVDEVQGFGAAVGAVASTWAQAEINLYCLFAVLLNTTPELAETALKKHGTAKKATDEARRIAAENLTGAELQSVTESLDSLDAVRLLRNRVQHDTWALKAGDKNRLYRVHRDQYLAFALKLLDVQRLGGTPALDEAISKAISFAGEISEGYSVSELEKIARDIDAVSKLLLEAMFTIRISQVKASS